MKYNWYKYPIICIALLNHFKAWEFWKLRKRIKATLAWRKEIGMFPKNYRFTINDAFTFGHWLVGQNFLVWW